VSRGGYTVLVSDVRYLDAFVTPLQLEFKLVNREMGIGLPSYTYLTSAIENGRIASLGLCGADIESNVDIENIQKILNLGSANYEDQIFTIPITINDLAINVKLKLEFGIGRDLRIEGRRVVGVNRAHQNGDEDGCFVVSTGKPLCLELCRLQ